MVNDGKKNDGTRKDYRVRERKKEWRQEREGRRAKNSVVDSFSFASNISVHTTPRVKLVCVCVCVCV